MSIRLSSLIFIDFTIRIPNTFTFRDLHGKIRKRHPWGVVGLSVEEGEAMIERQESEVKTVPLSTLEPLCAWTDLEKENLSRHIREPIRFLCMPNLDAWVS